MSSSFSCLLSRLLYRVAKADAPTLVWLRRLLAAVVCVAGLASIGFSAQSLFYPYVYMKDFVQEYLLARAVLAGVNPYLPVSELAHQFIGSVPNAIFPHPTPHPPPVAIIALPLGLLGYQQAAVVWFVFEIGCVCVAVSLLLNWLGVNARLWRLSLCTLAVSVWHPFWIELVSGQLMVLLFLILLLSWRALRADHPIRGGILLGMVVSLKLIGWPIVLFLGLRKNWRAVEAVIVTVVAMNGIAALLMGYQAVWYYYAKVGSVVGSLYRAYVLNYSVWSVGWRLFAGTGASIMAGAEALPVLASPLLARSFAVLLPLLLVIVGVIMAYRARDYDIAFAIVVCVSILVNPVAWIHYLILATLPLCVIGRQLVRQCFPQTETCIAIVCGLLLLISHRQWENWAIMLGSQTIVGKVTMVNPWILIVLTMSPALLVLILMGLLRCLDKGHGAACMVASTCRKELKERGSC